MLARKLENPNEDQDRILAGRITKASSRSGLAEFAYGVKINDFVYYSSDDEPDQKYVCRITRLQSTKYSAGSGNYVVLKPASYVPKDYTPLYRWTPKQMSGSAVIGIGSASDGNPITIRLNDLFCTTLVAGKTGQGKTHLCISLSEGLLIRKVPHLIIDTQDEFTNLVAVYPEHAEIIDGSNFSSDNIINSLKSRKTIVLSLGALVDSEKTAAVGRLLVDIKVAKERDYKESKYEFPPIIITIDEVEIYAPHRGMGISVKHAGASRQILIEYSKRMRKFGVGLICVAQQLTRFDADVRSQSHNAMIFLMDNAPDLASLRSLKYVGAKELTTVRGLSVGECLVLGRLSEVPLVSKIPNITCGRTKPTNFEALLGFEESPIFKRRETRTNTDAREEEDRNMICGGCGVKTVPVVVRNESATGKISHVHEVCQKCKDEYCESLGRWLKEPSPESRSESSYLLKDTFGAQLTHPEMQRSMVP